jgi:hypothetical protein
MRPFREKFVAKWNEEFLAPLERDLGVKLDDYAKLPQGQFALAVTQDGWQGKDAAPPGLLLLLDTREKSDQLKKLLADLRKKWVDGGKKLRTEKIRDVEFSVITLTSNDVPKTLKNLFPSAASFSPKEGEPPHFTAYGAGANKPVIGYAFWTTEVVPLERGYGGPIVMLVGLDMKGVISGIVIGDHREPYGNFSIDMPQFAAQFRNKDIRDPFKLGEDIDAVSRATITMSSAVRSIRNAARRVARTLLTPPGATKP